jgi:hypothetical protein
MVLREFVDPVIGLGGLALGFEGEPGGGDDEGQGKNLGDMGELHGPR